MKAAGYYLKLKYNSFTLYECLVCARRYIYAHPARDCCLENKPCLALHETAQIVEGAPPLPHIRSLPRPRTRQPGNGIVRRDRWGHHYRGKYSNLKKLFADYHRAFNNLAKEQRHQQVQKLETLYPTYEIDLKPKKHRSPLQRMAYAWYMHNWEQLKNAAFDLAYDQAIVNRIEDWRPELTAEISTLTAAAKQTLKRLKGNEP